MRDEDEWMDDLARDRWGEIAIGAGLARPLSLEGWRQSPIAVQRRLVRLIASGHGQDEIGFEAVERALAVGREDGPPRAQLGHGLVVERQRDRLVFTHRAGGDDMTMEAPAWHPDADLAEILIDEEQLQARIAELRRADHRGVPRASGCCCSASSRAR